MTSALERLLGYLDQAGVAEIIVTADRPIVVRVDGALQPISHQAYDRDAIEMLVDGTRLRGLIHATRSQAGIDVDVCGRRVNVEIVSEGTNVAMRITHATTVAPELVPPSPRVSFSTPPPNRTSTPVTSPPATRTATPIGGVPVSRTTTPSVPPLSRTTTPVQVSRTTSRAGIPIGDETGVPRSITTQPTNRTVTPARTLSADDTGVPRAVTTQPTNRTATPVGVPIGVDAQGSSRTPAMGVRMPGTTLPITNATGEPTPEEFDGQLALEQWTGPRVIDERANVTALVPLVRAARAIGATDLHLAAGRPVMIRRVGNLEPLSPDAMQAPVSPVLRNALTHLTAQTAQGFLLPLLGPNGRRRLATVGYVDLAVEVPGAGRMRGNVSQQQDGVCGTFRLISQTTPTLEALALPKELTKVIGHHQGLVVIAGPNGHGKTTTMAALVDLLNSTRTDHIITIEDPVEIEHPVKKALVSQREVNRHTLDFVAALKASLREDPDIIVIGELRDAETVEIALTAAETGHLVLATMSTPSAMRTIDRLIDMFPPDEQPQVRSSLASTLRAVIAQRLLPTTAGDGLVAAVELVTGVLPLAAMIRDNKLFQLPNLMQRGRAFGMIRLDDSLLDLVRAKRITDEVALSVCDSRKEMTAALFGQQPTQPLPKEKSGLFGWKGRGE